MEYWGASAHSQQQHDATSQHTILIWIEALHAKQTGSPEQDWKSASDIHFTKLVSQEAVPSVAYFPATTVLHRRGMHAQLGALAALVALIDPQLAAFLKSKGADNYFFCYRWLLIHFKRDFPFDEARALLLSLL